MWVFSSTPPSTDYARNLRPSGRKENAAMKESRFSPDDPRLTAYALGELDPAETAAVEAALRNDPVAREIVADIRATAAQLEAALGAEPVAAQAGARLIPEQTGVR